MITSLLNLPLQRLVGQSGHQEINFHSKKLISQARVERGTGYIRGLILSAPEITRVMDRELTQQPKRSFTDETCQRIQNDWGYCSGIELSNFTLNFTYLRPNKY
jgi:hypothetical protein